MTKIQIELPDATAQAAHDAGLLTTHTLNRLLIDALKRKRVAEELLAVADAVAASGVDQMSMYDINVEVKAARADRH